MQLQDFIVRAVSSKRSCDPDGFSWVQDAYTKKFGYGRWQATSNVAMQQCSSDVRAAAYSGHAVDVDISDCYGRTGGGAVNGTCHRRAPNLS